MLSSIITILPISLLLFGLTFANPVLVTDTTKIPVTCRAVKVYAYSNAFYDCAQAISDITAELPSQPLQWSPRNPLDSESASRPSIPKVLTRGRCIVTVNWENEAPPAHGSLASPAVIKQVAQSIWRRCVGSSKLEGGWAPVPAEPGQDSTGLEVRVQYTDDYNSAYFAWLGQDGPSPVQ